LSSIVSLFIFPKFSRIFVYQVGPLTQIVPGIVLKLLFRKKLYLWVLDLWPESVFAYGFKSGGLSSLLLNTFVKTSYFFTDTVFVSCRGFIDKIKATNPGTEIVFASQWAPLNLCLTDTAPKSELKGRFNFTFAGNVGKVQNLENVIRGFALTPKSDNVRLNIVGDGSNLSSLQALVEDEKIDNVVFHGRRPVTEMPEWFEGSHVLIISLIDKPIFSLTVPAKFQAYLTADKPIFCIMNGEVAETVEKHKIGIVSKPDDIGDIKKGFEHFINLDEASFRGIEKNMKKLLEEDYDFDKIMETFTSKIFPDVPFSA
ncbi:MAG: glycosyltransferase family 4 protein, partial [Victivallales bacterium]